MFSPLLIWFSALGLGALLPAAGQPGREWIGARFLLALGLIPFLLYAGIAVADIGLRFMSWTVLGLATAGVIGLRFRLRGAGFNATQLLHPVFLFPLIAIISIAVHGGLTYEVYAWDEFSNWVGGARAAFLDDHFATEEMKRLIPGYTVGWPLFLAFPSVVAGRFDPAHGAVLPFLLHVGLLALLFDGVRRVLTRRSGAPRHLALSVAWLAILSLLAVEAGWKLFPTLLLIEKPQIYVIAACFGIGLLAQYDDADRPRLSLYLGGLLALGYLFKIAMITFLPAFAVMAGMAVWRDLAAASATGRGATMRRGALHAAALILPFAFVYLTWIPHQAGGNCLASPLALVFDAGPAGLWSEKSAVLLARFGEALFAYGANYKPPLTVLGVFGIIAGLGLRRLAPVSVAIILFFAVYLAGMFLAYLTCFSEFDVARLGAFERYMRLPLRCLHLIGPLMVLFAAAEAPVARRAVAALSERRSKIVTAAVAIPAAVLFLWQAQKLHDDIDEIGTRSRETPALIAKVRLVAREAAALKRLIARTGLNQPAILIVAQGSEGTEYNAARYHALAERRHETNPLYRLQSTWSFGPSPINYWMQADTEARMRERLAKADIIWPIHTDSWIEAILAPLIGDPDCVRRPTRYFLRRNQAGGLDCLPKTRPK